MPGPFPQGNPGLGIPPSSLLTPEQNAFFQGPSLPAQNLAQFKANVRSLTDRNRGISLSRVIADKTGGWPGNLHVLLRHLARLGVFRRVAGEWSWSLEEVANGYQITATSSRDYLQAVASTGFVTSTPHLSKLADLP